MLDDQKWQDFRSRNESVMTDARAAVQSAMLVNGGAFAAILAFVGSQANSSRLHVDPVGIRTSLLAFTIGVGLGALSAATSYLTNYGYLSQAKALLEAKRSKGKLALYAAIICHNISIVSVVSSIGLFCYGAYLAAQSITGS